MSVTIQAMEDIATSLPEISFGASGDIGNTIEVTDLGDDMGMSLLANNKYMGSDGSSGGNSGGNSFHLESGGGGGTSMNIPAFSGGVEEISIDRLDTLQPINLDLGSSPSAPQISISREAASPYQAANSFGPGGAYGNQQSSSGPSITLNSGGPPRDPIKEAAEKAELINKLQRLEAKGFPVAKRFTMDNGLDEIKAEFNRLVDARQLETSIKFQRNMLMGFVTGLEWMNNKFDPFDLKLDGWSEAVHENVEDYDEIFEELYDKYKEKGKMPPEARLIFQMAGSGFMCHLTNSYFKSKMPSADDIFKKNPELAKQFAAAAATSASPAFGNFMGMAMGGGGSQQQQQQQPQGVPLGMASGPGAFFNSPQMPQHVAANPPPVQTARREMRGPTGVDDILKTFEEVRLAEEQQSMNMPFNPPSANNSPAMAAAEELQSLASGDMGSVTTERTARGGRRRRQAPAGNVVSLNV
jgi:hypothetical protein